MAVSFRPRRGLAVEWTTKNPLLGEGEWGYEVGTGRYKVGDGYRRWIDLPYFTNEEVIKAYVDAQIDALVINVDGVTVAEFNGHVNADLPHPIYDDGSDLTLLYLNAKV